MKKGELLEEREEMIDPLENAIIRIFHVLKLKNIEGDMKVLRPKVEKIKEDGWVKLEKTHSFLQKTKKLAETEYANWSSMPEIKNYPKYPNLLILKKEEFVDYIDRLSKGLEDWFYKKREGNKDYTFTEIGFGGRERGVEKTSEEILEEIQALLNDAKSLFENFKSGRFEVYDLLSRVPKSQG